MIFGCLFPPREDNLQLPSQHSYHIEGRWRVAQLASILLVSRACNVWVSKLQLLELRRRLISPHCMVKHTFLLTSKLVNLHLWLLLFFSSLYERHNLYKSTIHTQPIPYYSWLKWKNDKDNLRQGLFIHVCLSCVIRGYVKSYLG